MKKVMLIIASILLVLSFASCQWDEPVKSNELTTEHILSIDPPDHLYYMVQGATFDGEYFYIAFINKYGAYETAIIVKADKNGNVVKKSDQLPLDHANSITILENGNLMVAHCQSPDGHYYRYSIIDKDTFEIVKTADLSEPFMAIAYSKENKCFVSGEWNGDKMNIHSRDFLHRGSFMVKYAEGTIPQSYFCTEDKIYAVRFYNDGGFHNYLYAFSYLGETLLEYEMELPRICEAEAVSVIDGDIYVICAQSGRCEIYKITNLIIGE